MWTEITRPNYERRGGALRKRPDGSRVGVDRAAHAAAQEDRPAEDDGPAPCHGCGHVHGLDGLPVGDVAERTSLRLPRSSAISTTGAPTACWRASTITWSWRPGSWKDARPARAPG